MSMLPELLKEILTLPSPSGFERPVQLACVRVFEQLGDEIRFDALGNLIARRPCAAAKPMRLMLAAHCDEIGFMIKHIDDRGLMTVGAVGGIDPQVAVAQPVVIHTANGAIPAVLGVKPIHLKSSAERDKLTPLDDLILDAGFTSREEAVAAVEIGDAVTFDRNPVMLAGSRFSGRGVDDRGGVYVMVEAMRRLAADPLKHVELVAVATVQEELGLRGGTASAFGVDPDAAIVIESGFATDTPGIKPQEIGSFSLGGGPIISRGPNITPPFFDLIRKTAKEGDRKIQIKAEPKATGTDANVIQLTRGGIVTALVRFPLRYMHTPVEVVDLQDVEGLIELLVATIRNLDAEPTRFMGN